MAHRQMIWLIPGILLCVWALLRVLGDERQRLLINRTVLEHNRAAEGDPSNPSEPSN